MARLKPLQALLFGAAAGALGSLVQGLFFKATAKLQSPPPLAQEPRMEESAKEASRALVHSGFGKLWGGAYAVARESLPSLASPLGAALFGAGVWMVSDNVLLPSFKLSPWPQSVPLRNHAVALAANLAYGAAVVGGYELLRRRPWLLALTALRIRRTLAWLPASARQPAIKAATKVWGLGRNLPIVVEDRT